MKYPRRYLERRDPENYLKVELTELDHLFHTNGSILTFRFLSEPSKQIDGKSSNKTTDLNLFTY